MRLETLSAHDGHLATHIRYRGDERLAAIFPWSLPRSGAPPGAREIDESVGVEGDAIGFEHGAL